MNRKYKKAPLVYLFIFALVIIFLGLKSYNSNQNELVIGTEIYNDQAKKKSENKKEIEQSITEDIPGFVSWGDSLTAGAGGEGVTYPKVLQSLINKNINNITVTNNGVGGETTNTILGRVGSVPYVAKEEFTIPKTSSEEVEIELESSNGKPVAPLRQSDIALNPITINGVEGVIRIEQENYTSEDFTYYFKRTLSGEEVNVDENTEIKTNSLSEYDNFVPIIFIGTNGGYVDYNDLITQINSILDLDKSNEKFIVIGLTTEDAEYWNELEKKMESEYGERYINLREIISTSGLEMVEIEPTDEDLVAIEKGAIPPSLLSDNIHFNSTGYDLIGNIIYERMVEIGYFDNILKLKNDLKAL